MDLRDGLKKVLASQGTKKFFFAYGVGKRKDKKGEGELAVSGKKPKKAEIIAELADAGDVYEGFCWGGNGAETGATVYFQGKGKKLSTALVAKMVKTAKTTTGKLYDFQMPSPEEEAKADKLSEEEGEGDEDPAAVAAEPANAEVSPAPSKATPPPVAKAPTAPKPAAKAMRDATLELEKEWERRMIAVEPKVEQAEKAKQGEAKKWRKSFESAATLGSDEKYAQAIEEVKNLELLLDPAYALARETYETSAGSARLLMVHLNEEDGTPVREFVEEANALLMKAKKTAQDFTDATTKLDELSATLEAELPLVYKEAAMAAAQAKAAGGPAAAAGDLNAALARWQAARATVIGQIDTLLAKIATVNHARTADAVIELKAVRANLTARPDNRKSVDELIRYLENDDVVADIDAPNPFGVDLDIQVPLLESLDELSLCFPG